jgi:hypothetical protein
MLTGDVSAPAVSAHSHRIDTKVKSGNRTRADRARKHGPNVASGDGIVTVTRLLRSAQIGRTAIR